MLRSHIIHYIQHARQKIEFCCHKPTSTQISPSMSNNVPENGREWVRLWYPFRVRRFGVGEPGRYVDREVGATPIGREIQLVFESFGIWDLVSDTPPRLSLSIFLHGVSLTIPMPNSSRWGLPHVTEVDGWIVLLIFGSTDGRITLNSVRLRPSV